MIFAAATVATPSLGQSVDLVRPGLGAIGARFRSGTATRITSTNATIGTSGTSFVGLLTLTSPRPATSAEVGVDSTTGDVTERLSAPVPGSGGPSRVTMYPMNQGITNRRLVRRLFSIIVATAVCGAGALVARGQSPVSIWDGVYTEAQAKEGETVYFSQCAECHGPDFAGREQAPALA